MTGEFLAGLARCYAKDTHKQRSKEMLMFAKLGSGNKTLQWNVDHREPEIVLSIGITEWSYQCDNEDGFE